MLGTLESIKRINKQTIKSTTLFLLNFFVGVCPWFQLKFIFLFQNVRHNGIFGLFSFDFGMDLGEFSGELFKRIVDWVSCFGTDFVVTDSPGLTKSSYSVGIDSVLLDVALVAQNAHYNVGLSIFFNLS